MRYFIFFTVLLLSNSVMYAQESDYIVVKKKNGVVLKTYYVGSFISAERYSGFKLNGIIKSIHNDSLLIRQEETRLMSTEFGTKVDTLVYMVGLYYNEIRKFNFGHSYEGGRKKGFSQVTIPKLLKIGGTGFFVLELVNSIYRGESLKSNNKPAFLGTAAGVAATGFIWSHLSKRRNRVGGKYQVEYIRAHSAIR